MREPWPYDPRWNGTLEVPAYPESFVQELRDRLDAVLVICDSHESEDPLPLSMIEEVRWVCRGGSRPSSKGSS